MPRQKDFTIVLYSLGSSARRKNNTNLAQVPDFYKEEELTIEKADDSDQTIVQYTRYSLGACSVESRYNVYKSLRNFKFYTRKTESKLHLSHHAMVVSACLSPGQQTSLRSYAFTLCTRHYVPRKTVLTRVWQHWLHFVAPCAWKKYDDWKRQNSSSILHQRQKCRKHSRR